MSITGIHWVDTNRDGRDSQETKNRICQERKAIKLSNSIWWSEKISKKRKYNVYTSIVKKIIIMENYGGRKKIVSGSRNGCCKIHGNNNRKSKK